jgi:O-antigen/teichoic acid export membrane protein
VSVSEDVLDTGEAGGQAIRGGALRAASHVAVTLLALVSVPLLVRHLGLVEFGRYFTVVSLIGLVGGVTDVGLGAVVLREYTVRTGADREAFMRSVLGARLVLASAGVAAAVLFAFIAGYSGALVLGTALAGVGLLLGIAQHTYAVPLAAGLLLGRFTAIELFGGILVTSLVVTLVLASAGTAAFLAIPIPVGLVLVGVTMVLVRGQIPLRPSLDLGELRAVVRETLPVAAATVMHTLYARVTIVLMSLIATEVATGVFGTALRVVEVAAGLPVALVATTFPILARAARDDHARLSYALQRLLEIAVIGGIGLSLAVGLGADTIIEVLGGESARRAAEVLRILAAILAVVFLTTTWQHALFALGRYRALMVVNSVAFAFTVVCVLGLVPALGATGAAVAVLAGETVLMLLSSLALLRGSPHLRPNLGTMSRVSVAAGLGLLVGLVPGFPGALDAMAGVATYAAMLIVLGAVPAELRAALVRPMFGSRPPPAEACRR